MMSALLSLLSLVPFLAFITVGAFRWHESNSMAMVTQGRGEEINFGCCGLAFFNKSLANDPL